MHLKATVEKEYLNRDPGKRRWIFCLESVVLSHITLVQLGVTAAALGGSPGKESVLNNLATKSLQPNCLI